MCRLLYIKSNKEFEIKPYLEKFAIMSKNSKEYQGHGWGLAYLDETNIKTNVFQYYKNINPIWTDDLTFSNNKKTRVLLVHARSAFDNKDINIENNMPFYDEKYVFIFNGELRGVKIKENGRIGAEKIFNYIKRFDKGDIKAAMEKAIQIIKKRTDLIKALNIIIADKNNAYINNYYTLDEDYFCLRIKKNNVSKKDSKEIIICSQPLDNEEWQKLDKGIFVF